MKIDSLTWQAWNLRVYADKLMVVLRSTYYEVLAGLQAYANVGIFQNSIGKMHTLPSWRRSTTCPYFSSVTSASKHLSWHSLVNAARVSKKLCTTSSSLPLDRRLRWLLYVELSTNRLPMISTSSARACNSILSLTGTPKKSTGVV